MTENQPYRGSPNGKNNNSKSDSKKVNEDDMFDNFCYMVVEEFLMRKNMSGTLDQFRSEWQRPEDKLALLSWYDVSLKLHLADIAKESKYQTVLENITSELIKESSRRTRKPAQVSLQGLATLRTKSREKQANRLGSSMPRSSSPQSQTQNLILQTSSSDDFKHTLSDGNRAMYALSQSLDEDMHEKDIEGGGGIDGAPLLTQQGRRRITRKKKVDLRPDNTAAAAVSTTQTQTQTQTHRPTPQTSADIRKQSVPFINAIDASRKTSAVVLPQQSKTKTAMANHNIPDDIRLRSIHREITVVKENLQEVRHVEASKARELKRLNIDELAMTKTAESLGTVKSIACGCCTLSFYPLNLPLSVSYKAIFDLRRRWSADTGTALTAEDLSERQAQVPRCYDRVKVCRFCAQFFHDLDRYRPSLEAAALEEKRRAAEQRRERERQYWDPLKMCEKDRASRDEGGGVGGGGGGGLRTGALRAVNDEPNDAASDH